jgi:hypothetical protein
MKWIVLEENPKPDNYIAVIITEEMKRLRIESQAHSVYNDSDKALARARQLRDQFGVRMIRVFQNDGYSIPLKS